MPYWAGMTKCPECGKLYLGNSQSVYHLRLSRASHLTYYCSWTCMRAAEKRDLEKREMKKCTRRQRAAKN